MSNWRRALIAFTLVTRWQQWQACNHQQANVPQLRGCIAGLCEHDQPEMGARRPQRPRRRVLQTCKWHKTTLPLDELVLIAFVSPCFGAMGRSFTNLYRVAWRSKLSTTSRIPTSCSRFRLVSCTRSAKSRKYRSTCGTRGLRRSCRRSTICKSALLRPHPAQRHSWKDCRPPFLARAILTGREADRLSKRLLWAHLK